MKIKKETLKTIIREELEQVLSESKPKDIKSMSKEELDAMMMSIVKNLSDEEKRAIVQKNKEAEERKKLSPSDEMPDYDIRDLKKGTLAWAIAHGKDQ